MRLIGSLTLTLILAASAYAGNMPNEIVQPPPPPTTVTTEKTPEPTETEDDTVTELILTVVSILGLI